MTYQCVLKSPESKVELQKLQKVAYSIQLQAQSMARLLLLKQKRDQLNSVKMVLQHITQLHDLSQSCQRYFYKGKNYLSVYQQTSEEFDQLLQTNSDLQQIGCVQQIVSDKHNIDQEAKLLKSSEF